MLIYFLKQTYPTTGMKDCGCVMMVMMSVSLNHELNSPDQLSLKYHYSWKMSSNIFELKEYFSLFQHIANRSLQFECQTNSDI